MTLADDAVRYARLGYRVFPVRNGSKAPITSNGFKGASRDEGLIAAWWAEHPDAAIATPDTCTVDIEAPKPPKNGDGPLGPDGLAAWAELVERHGTVDAPTALTGLYFGVRGVQLHFAYRDDVKTGGIAPGVEVRASGSYVLLPPSPHPTGVSYEGELPPIGELPPLPDWVPPLRAAWKAKTKAASNGGGKVHASSRHDAWIVHAGELRRAGVPLEHARERLRRLRDEQFENPAKKTDDELEGILAYYEGWDGPPLKPRGPDLGIAWLDQFRLRQVEYVDRPLLQAATFHLLGGRPGVGKGAVCTHWVSRCTTGDLYGEPRVALWLSSEDDPEIDLGPRVEAAGGNRALVALIPHTFQLPGSVDWLRETVARLGNVGLIGIDPLSNHTGSANTDRESEVRMALMPLGLAAATLEVPIIGVRHISTKEAKGDALGRILGSTAWIGVPRVVLAAVKDRDDPDVVHVHPVKGNRVRASESGRRFRLEGRLLPGFTETVVAAVADGVSDVDINAMLAGEKTDTASSLAREAILATLRAAGGRMESDQLDAAVAADTGVTAKTVRNLRAELKNNGLIRAYPDKDEQGTILRWFVALTLAASAPDPESDPRERPPDGPVPSRARGYGTDGHWTIYAGSRDPVPDCPPPREGRDVDTARDDGRTLEQALDDPDFVRDLIDDGIVARMWTERP